jgi:eukaryotic-like serine/threonine-protein kinase
VAARDFMLNIFARATQEKSRGADITARDLLETGRKDVLTRLGGQPKLQAELLRGIAKIQGDMGEYVTADSTFSELVRVYAHLHQPAEEAMARADHAHNALQTNNPALAAQLLEGAESVPGRPTNDIRLNARLAEVEGLVALNRGDSQRAQEGLGRSLQSAIASLGEDHLQTFKLGQALVRAHRDGRNYDAAIALQEKLRRIAPRVHDLNPSELAVLDWEQVNLLVAAGRSADALTLIDVTLPRCVSALGPQEQVCRFLFLSEGQTLLRLGRTEQALKGVDRLQTMQRDATLPFLQVEALLLEFRLKTTLGGATDIAQLSDRVRAFGESGAEVSIAPAFKVAALLALAEARLRTGDTVQARLWAGRALASLGDAAHRPASLRLRAVGTMLDGMALLHEGHAEEAMVLLNQSQSDLVAALGAQHPITQLFALNSALALAELQRDAEALALVRHADPVLRAAFGPEAPAFVDVIALERWLENRSTLPDSTRARHGTPGSAWSSSRYFFS